MTDFVCSVSSNTTPDLEVTFAFSQKSPHVMKYLHQYCLPCKNLSMFSPFSHV